MSYWYTICSVCGISINANVKEDLCPKCGTVLNDWEYDSRTDDELEASLVNNTYICPKCEAQHSKGGEDLSGQVCCAIACKR